jgi:hypothetical protein
LGATKEQILEVEEHEDDSALTLTNNGSELHKSSTVPESEEIGAETSGGGATSELVVPAQPLEKSTTDGEVHVQGADFSSELLEVKPRVLSLLGATAEQLLEFEEHGDESEEIGAETRGGGATSTLVVPAQPLEKSTTDGEIHVQDADFSSELLEVRPRVLSLLGAPEEQLLEDRPDIFLEKVDMRLQDADFSSELLEVRPKNLVLLEATTEQLFEVKQHGDESETSLSNNGSELPNSTNDTELEEVGAETIGGDTTSALVVHANFYSDLHLDTSPERQPFDDLSRVECTPDPELCTEKTVEEMDLSMALTEAPQDLELGTFAPFMLPALRGTRSGGTLHESVVSLKTLSKKDLDKKYVDFQNSITCGLAHTALSREANVEPTFVDYLGNPIVLVPTDTVTMEAPDFGNHIGRCVKVAVNLLGWTGAFVERKACKEDADPSDIWGMHAVQFFDDFMNFTKYEHAITQRDSRKVYSEYFWLEKEEMAGRLVFTDSFAMGWSRPEKCPKVWRTRNLAGVVSPEGLALSQGALPAPTPLLTLAAPP